MQREAAHVDTASNQPVVTPSTPAPAPAAEDTAPGLTFERYFTREGVDPFDEIEWELRSAVIANERGEVVFEQRDLEIPRTWSQMATRKPWRISFAR